MRLRANGQPAKLRLTYIHWGESGSIHASPACGSTATRVVGDTKLVSCPKCRRAAVKRAQERLNKAAPELLEALKLADSTGALERYPKVEVVVRAAIAKAEGK